MIKRENRDIERRMVSIQKKNSQPKIFIIDKSSIIAVWINLNIFKSKYNQNICRTFNISTLRPKCSKKFKHLP